jgi:membrane protein YqaA with SNARE-associated domain
MNTNGYLPHRIIKGIVFWILAICITGGTLAAILSEWDVIGYLVAERCLWTAVYLALGCVTFLLCNYFFGDMARILFGQRESDETSDPAFASRLRKAKVDRPADLLPYERE